MSSDGMTETEQRQIVVEGADPRELYGPQEVYLEQIRTLHPRLKIVARGSSLKVFGPQPETERFATKMEGLVAYYLKYGHISREVVAQCFSGGPIAEEAPADKDVILYGNGGTIVRARTVNQRRLVQAYDKHDLLFAVGPAGSGKTYTAIALAVRALKEKEVRRIILTRPAVEAGERLGFLPGDLQNKVDPYLRPLYDALFEMLGADAYAKYLERGNIEVAPLAYMRGRTLSDAFIILDEAQNTTTQQIKMFLTRMGMNTKMIVTGDMTQIDLPQSQTSGLVQALRILKGVKGISFIELNKKDIVRHKLVTQIVEAYEKFDKEAKAEREKRKAEKAEQ